MPALTWVTSSGHGDGTTAPTGLNPTLAIAASCYARPGKTMVPTGGGFPVGPAQGIRIQSASGDIVLNGALTAQGISDGWQFSYNVTPGTGIASVLSISLRLGSTFDPLTDYATAQTAGGVGIAQLVNTLLFVSAWDYESGVDENEAYMAGPWFSTGEAPPVITTTTLPDVYDVAPDYDQTVVAVDGAGTRVWTIDSGSLPAGLALNAATGVISGSVTGAPGTYNFVVRVTDDAGTDTQDLSIRVLTATGGLEDMLIRTYVAAPGAVLSSSGWNAEQDNIIEQIGALLGGDLHPRAGITRRQISDRFDLVVVPISVVGYGPRSDVALGTYTTGTTGTLIPPSGAPYQFDLCPITLPNGEAAWVAGILSKIRFIDSPTSGFPNLRLYKNADLIGGGGQIHSSSNQWYAMMSDDPFAQPVVDVQNGDYLYGTIENSDGSTDTRIQGHDIFVLLKVEHLPG